MSNKHVVVVGGGAIGTACAYYLRRRDCDVTLLEMDRQGQGGAGGNCGLLAYSHVLPLNEPGAVRKTLKALLGGNSPLRIKPRISPTLWMWLLKFAVRCNRRDMLASARARAALIDSSASLYRELMAAEALDCEWEDRGCLFVLKTNQGKEHFAEVERLLREEFDKHATWYDAAAVVELEPSIRPGSVVGGWHYERDAHARPDKLLHCWRTVLERDGVTVREHARVTGLVQRGGSASAVRVSGDELSADAFVMATGAWTPLLNRELGCRVPIQPGKGYSITMSRPDVCPQMPINFVEHKVVATPMRSGYRLGSTMEFAGYDDSINRRRLALLTEGASHYMLDAVTGPVEEEWYGWRPMTYDGKPIIDRVPAADNVFVAAGHNMLGLTMAPATGRLVAEMVTNQTPHIDPTPFSVNRF